MATFKKIIIVVGPIVLIVMLVLSFDRGTVPNRIDVVDIRTGDISSMGRTDMLLIPARSKDGELVLYPVQKNDDGVWCISEHHMPLVRKYFREHRVDPAIDLETCQVIGR
ncbi:MAG: hypothetical protein KAS72_02665 [Phycisphaerales bacterium]|nr:hypothetical protein [Phycisphaerales bacterium]